MHLFQADSRSDEDDDRKRQALKSLEDDTAYLRIVGDLLVAAHFNGRSKSDRADKRERVISPRRQIATWMMSLRAR